MKTRVLIVACMALTFAGSGIQAQNQNNQNRQDHTQFDSRDQQVTRDWYKQHQRNAPVGLRTQDRLPADQESKLQRGNVLPRDLQKQEHPIPRDLSRQLPPPPRNSRYVAVGGHVAQIDKSHRVQDVIRLDLNF
jgi:Ni/Co efflux regulator RcnB